MRETEIRQVFFLVEHSEKSRLAIARTALRSARKAAKAVPDDKRQKITANELQANNLAMSRSHKYEVPGYYYLSDGIAASWTTERRLDDLSHRIIIPTEGKPTYRRESIRGDVQAIGNIALTLEGLEQIATDDEAALGMLYPTDLSIPEIVHLIYDGVEYGRS